MKRTAIQKEIMSLIRFYEKNEWDWTNAAEYTLCRESGRLEYILRGWIPRGGRPPKSDIRPKNNP